ncbi:MAG: ParB N-terminal domain-containing protein [Aminivibrio sp.]|jgi:hypothetical protein
MKYQLIDVAAIASSAPRNDFAPSLIEKLADSILQNEGLIQPLLLRTAGQGKYEVASRHLEYWAAVRAREKDPRRGEMINAFVVEPSAERAVIGQLGLVSPLPYAPSVKQGHFSEGEEIHKLKSAMAESVRLVLRDELTKLLPAIDARLAEMEDAFQERLSAMERILSEPERPKPKPALPQEPFTKAQLSRTTVKILRQIIKEKGIPAAGLRLKAELIDAILNFCR